MAQAILGRLRDPRPYGGFDSGGGGSMSTLRETSRLAAPSAEGLDSLRPRPDVRELLRNFLADCEEGREAAVDPKVRKAYIYRGNKTVETLAESGTLSGEDVCPGFELSLKNLFESAE